MMLRFADWLTPARAFFVGSAPLLLGAAMISTSLWRPVGPGGWMILVLPLPGFLAIWWTRRRLAETVELFTPAVIDLEAFDASTLNLIERYPSAARSSALGLALFLLVGMLLPLPAAAPSVPGILWLMSILLTTVATGFGLDGLYWTYRLFGNLRSQKIHVLSTHRVRALSEYVVLLTAIAVMILGLSALLWIETESAVLLWVIAVLFVGVLCGCAVSLWAIYGMALQAKGPILCRIEDLQSQLVPNVSSDATAFSKKHSDLRLLEELRAMIVARGVGVIPWDAILARVVFPVVVGATVVWCSHAMQPSPASGPQKKIGPSTNSQDEHAPAAKEPRSDPRKPGR